ncbi:SRPBCC family protein [bacterium]|nr:SRPBCC family protein [bacterium]
MADTRSVFVTYIRTTPTRLWQALRDPEFTRRYWFATRHESDWTPGSPWRLMIPDGRVAHSGEVLEVVPERRLVLSWRAEFNAAMHAEGHSRVTFELEPVGESVRLTVTHEIDRPDSKLVKTLAHGWPHLLSSLKSLLETGEPLTETSRWPKGM